MAVQPDGRLVVAGQASVAFGVVDFAVARYAANGDPDGTFGTGGKVLTDIAGKTDLLAALVLQPDGRIVVVGRVAPDGGANPDTGVVRYEANGVPDETFGSHGIARLPLAGTGWDEATGVVLQPDGKLVLSVEAVVGSTFDFTVARLTTDGTPDNTFGSGGVTSTDFAGDHDVVHALALQADGSILLVGQSSNINAPDFGVVRYTPGGSLDTALVRREARPRLLRMPATARPASPSSRTGASWSAAFARNGTTTGLGLVRIVP